MVEKSNLVITTRYVCIMLAICVVIIPSMTAMGYTFYDGKFFSVEYPSSWDAKGNDTCIYFSDDPGGRYFYIDIGKEYPTIGVANNYSTFANGSFDEMTMHFLETLKIKSQVKLPGSNRESGEEIQATGSQSQMQTATSELNENASIWNDRGVDLYAQGKYDEALGCYDKSIKLDPKFALAWNNKGSALFSQGNYDEAIKAYEMAIKIDPKYSSAWNNKGSALHNQGRYSEAIQAYDKAIEFDSRYANAWYNKFLALKSLGRVGEADDAYAKAKELGYIE